MIWYGLTQEEAQARCAQLGLQASFQITMDPKAPAGVQGTYKVIRAAEKADSVAFLLGCFSPPDA